MATETEANFISVKELRNTPARDQTLIKKFPIFYFSEALSKLFSVGVKQQKFAFIFQNFLIKINLLFIVQIV